MSGKINRSSKRRASDHTNNNTNSPAITTPSGTLPDIGSTTNSTTTPTITTNHHQTRTRGHSRHSPIHKRSSSTLSQSSALLNYHPTSPMQSRSHLPSSSSRPGHSSAARSQCDQSRSFWNVVVGPDQSNASGHLQQHPQTASVAPAKKSSSDGRSSPDSSGTTESSPRPLSRPVPIAPSGPVHVPRDESDGYRFKCPEEGCDQKYRHRSSRSRHRRNVHRSPQ